MSRLYDTVEPNVIDEEMLQKAVEEQGPTEEAGRIAKQESIDFGDVETLRLDFKNILKIDNLWSFKSLTKLQLDNNIIEKIEGLEMLTNLRWLDLSFNNIEVIEGLDTLVKLEDLTLYNNRISRIENMELLTNLHIISFGNNDLQELDNLIYLRKFKKLKTLNLSGNPFCELDNYKTFVIAHISSLQFLDYRLIEEQSREAAEEKYQLSIDGIMDAEKKKEEREEAEEKQRETVSLHKAAFIEGLDGSSLFDGMYGDDGEGQKLNGMPGVDELVIVFREKYQSVCSQLFEYGLQEQRKRQDEVTQFWECVEEEKTANKAAGVKLINEFLDYKKKLFRDVTQMSDHKLVENKMAEYNQEVSTIWDKLMGLELQLVDQLEEVIKDFDRNLQDMIASFVENVQGHLNQCRDLENAHNEKMMEIAIVTLEKVIKNELDDDISEDLRMLFVDKDTVVSAVTSSHDVHLLKIDNKEDDMVTRSNQWVKGMIEKIHEEEEVQRNRTRISEINHLIDNLRDEVDTIEIIQGGNY